MAISWLDAEAFSAHVCFFFFGKTDKILRSFCYCYPLLSPRSYLLAPDFSCSNGWVCLKPGGSEKGWGCLIHEGIWVVSGGMFLFLVVVDARFHPVAASLAMVTSHLHDGGRARIACSK